jgi:hypothetical protein
VLAGDRQDVFVDLDLDLLRPDAGELGTDDEMLVLRRYLSCASLPSGVGRSRVRRSPDLRVSR